jgi:hypothetical protein
MIFEGIYINTAININSAIIASTPRNSISDGIIKAFRALSSKRDKSRLMTSATFVACKLTKKYEQTRNKRKTGKNSQEV